MIELKDTKKFLDQEIQFLEAEENAVKETVLSIRNTYAELKVEEGVLTVAEKFIKQLKEKVHRFENNYYSKLVMTLAKYASQSSGKEYPSYLDDAISLILEIKIDSEILSTILSKMTQHFNNIRQQNEKQSSFYNMINNIYSEIFHKLNDIYEIFGYEKAKYGTGISYESTESYQKLKQDYISKHLSEMRGSFASKYGAKIPQSMLR